MNDFLVTKETGMFALKIGNVILVKTLDADMMLRYLNAMFPEGTKVQWRIVP